MPATRIRYAQVHTVAVGRRLRLRDGERFRDRQVWGDTFTAAYHVPPKRMLSPLSVLDLGANIGLTTAHYRAMWPNAKVVGVEMDAENAALARENAPGATILQVAVASQDGTSFYDDAAPTDAYRLGGGGSSMVEARSLSRIVEEEFGEPVDFAKMDVEGMEWHLFDSTSWRPLVRNLLVELHGDEGSDPAKLVAFGVARLRDLGYAAEPHLPHPAAVFASAR